MAGGAGVPVTTVGLLASENWYPGGTKILKIQNNGISEQITFLAGEGGNTLNKPGGSATSSSSSCLVFQILRDHIQTKSGWHKVQEARYGLHQ